MLPKRESSLKRIDRLPQTYLLEISNSFCLSRPTAGKAVFYFESEIFISYNFKVRIPPLFVKISSMNFSKLKFTGIYLLLFLFASNAAAQQIEAEIKLQPFAVRIEGKIRDTGTVGKNWSFVQNYADVSGLGERIENFKLFDENGAEIALKKFIAGEFEAEKSAVSFSYEVKIKPPVQPTAAAHVSWLSDSHGLLTANDLFPQNFEKYAANLSFKLPDGWKILTTETRSGENAYKVQTIEKAVFLAGKNIREKSFAAENTNLDFAFAGEWQFTDEDAAAMAREIFAEHRKTFGAAPFSRARIFLLPFPQNVDFDRWRAETRGSTVTIISAPTAFKSNALNRLHEQLRHEIFHLWLPNSLNLSGNYDWFYEGFTFYQALKTGVRLNRIRFEDYLSTVARGFDLTEALTRRRSVSLVEASEKRWQNSVELIYAKGTIAAFLCDAELLRESKGKRDLDSIFREIFEKHRHPNKREDGSAAILRILKRRTEIVPVIEKYIEGDSKIEWQNDLAAFGIEAQKISGATVLKVAAKPNGRQKDLLDKLGYNQSRKNLPK